MSGLRRFVRRLWTAASRSRPDRRIEEELALHVEAQTADNVRAGLPPDEARRQALVKLGSPQAALEECRETLGLPIFGRLLADMGYAARGLARAPAFTLAVVAVFAIGIGASTAIFTVVNTVLLRPLPFHDPDRLVRLFTTLPSGRRFDASPGKFYDWQRDARSFDRMAAYPCCGVRHLALTGGGIARTVATTAVSVGFFEALHVRPIIGRVFREDDDTPAGKHVVVLSHRFWAAEFGGDHDALGRTLRLDDEPYVVIGVLPPTTALASWSPMASDVWIPLGLAPDARRSRGNHYLDAVARLRPGVDVAQAQREMNGIAARLGREYPSTDDRWGVQVVDLRASIGGDSRTMLLVLLGAVTILQLIACANVANLLFTRGMARHKEFALRAALGASRARILQQLLMEAILLAAAAGIVGLALAFAVLRLSSTLLATHVPRSDEIVLDVRVALFAVTLSIVSGVLAGTLPAWRAGRTDLNDTLKEGGRGASTVGLRTRRVLVATEVALSLMLLMAAGVLVQSLFKLRFVDAGFRADNVLTMRVGLVPTRYPTPAHRAAFYEEALRRLRALPGVESASTINNLPLTTGGAHTLTLEGYPQQDQAPAVQVRQITPGYLATMTIPVLRGRDIREGDTDVLLVSRRAAELYWGADDAVGRRASLNGISPQFHTVVGIVGDVKQRTLAEDTTPTVYWYGREPYGRTTFALRTSMPPARVAPAALAVIRAVDPEQPVADIRTMEEVRDTQLAPQRLSATLMIVFASVALLLAGIGIYSVLSYIVRGRNHEMAVRAALGAQSSDVVSLVLQEALMPLAVGIAAGIAGGLASSQLLGALVFETSAADPRLIALTAAVLLMVAGVAAVLPAYRALQLDPSKVLH